MKSASSNAKLTSGPVGTALFRMAGFMIFGNFSMVAFNIADTYFISQLGTGPLAAISFTFPVIMFIGSIAMGIGMGLASLLSHAIGEGDDDKIKNLATSGIILAVLVVAALSFLGILTIDPLFTLIGATAEELPLIRDYMIIWYVGMAFVVVPMVGNNAIRATGDTKVPAIIMMIGAAANVALDPLLIFGLGSIPAMGLKGAALATVISRSCTMVAALLILHNREHMLSLRALKPARLWNAWKGILYIGLPAGATHALMPVSMGIVTRIVASFGTAAVAAVGAGTRVEALAMLPFMALGSVMIPFIGQNLGAKLHDRIREALSLSNRFAILWGIGIFGVFYFSAHWIAGLFSDDAAVIPAMVLYLTIAPISYGLFGVASLSNTAFNGLQRPITSTVLNVVRMFVFLIPLTWLGAELYGLTGAIAGMTLSNMLAGLLSGYWVRRTLSDITLKAVAP